MMQVFQVREEKRDEIPAVTHVDFSARIQTVDKSTNKEFHSLLREIKNVLGMSETLLCCEGLGYYFQASLTSKSHRLGSNVIILLPILRFLSDP